MTQRNAGAPASRSTDLITLGEVQALLAGVSTGQKVFTGAYLTALPAQLGTSNLPGGQVRMIPVDLAAAGTADRIGVEVTGGTASAVGRLGIYSANPTTGRPTSLLLDAGTYDASTSGFKEIVISQALSAGRYYLACTTSNTVGHRSIAGIANLGAVQQTDLQFNAGAYIVGGNFATTGLPSTPSLALTEIGHRVYLRMA